MLIIEAESEVRLWWPVLPDLVFFSVYIKARLRCLLAGILPGMLHGNLAPLNKAELGESAVHKRQIERAHNNVQQAEIQYVQFTFTQNHRSMNSFRQNTVFSINGYHDIAPFKAPALKGRVYKSI